MTLQSNQFINILVPLPFSQEFTYKTLTPIPIGSYVEIPFGQKKLVGIVGSLTEPHSTIKDIKTIERVYEFPPLTPPFMRFIEWVAAYYMSSRGLILKMVLSLPKIQMDKLLEEPLTPLEKAWPIENMHLSTAQKTCAEKIIQTVETKKFQVQLLEGVTGSGKTEVYFKGIEKALTLGKQALVLLPEIALSQQWLERFECRFGFAPLVWHSSLTPAQRRKNWGTIIKGQAKVIVGARSALFLPYPQLGLIVVDEEHDASYKQESGVLYQARDMAIVRGRFETCPVILVSATPSLETLNNVQDKKYEHLLLEERHGEATLPTVHLVDMRKTEMASKWISTPLFQATSQALEKGQQVLLFLNRRGYSPFMVCASCGERPQCAHCDATLVYHKSQTLLRCHYCNYQKKSLLHCQSCKTIDSMKPCGPGVERLAEEVEQLFPTVKTVLMSSDTLFTPQKMQESFTQIEQGKAQLIIGTQMMAKGHHFPNLAVVGIIDGDLSLHGTDLRAAERTYQLLHQVSGRAGRAHEKGTVFIQTHCPDNPVMHALAHGNLQEFLAQEMTDRQLHTFPPFGRLAALILSSHKADVVEKIAKELARTIPQFNNVTVWGPTPAVLTRLKRQYRWRFLIKTEKNIKIQDFISLWLKDIKLPSTVKLQIDIDPYSFF